jgi:hypothetical protein
MPDAWEQEHGTFVFIPDAEDDPDGDGMGNLAEFQAGTHPLSAGSVLKFSQVMADAGFVTLEFLAASNRTYSLLYKPSLDALQWSKLADVPAHSTNRAVTITNNNSGDSFRLFRLVSPNQL